MAILASGRTVAPLAQLSDANMALLLTGLLLGGVLLVGAVLIAWAARWRRQQQSAGASPSEQLAHFRSLYEQGAISQEEFNRLRSLLGGQLRAEMKVPTKADEQPVARPNATPGPLPPATGSPPVNGPGPA